MSTTLVIVSSATPAAIVGALIALAPALLIRRRADNDLIEAGVAMAKAEELLTEYERTRNLPWYWPTDRPELPAAEPMPEAEVLHVAYPTQELHTVKMPAEQFDELVAGLNEADYAPRLAALADEVGLVQATTDPACCDAHNDEPCTPDAGFVFPCCGGCPDWVHMLSDRPAEDEDEVGDEQPGEAASSVPSRLGGWWREQCARIRELFRRAPVNPPYVGRHWVPDVQHTGQFPVINIPAQRDGEVQA